MPFRVETKGKYKVVRTEGELTACTSAERLKNTSEQLIDCGCRFLVVDLSKAVIIDSSVISSIVLISRKISGAGGELVVLSSRNRVLEALLQTSMDRVIRIIEHERELK